MSIDKQINPEQAIYLQTCVSFIFYFINNKNEDYESLFLYLKNDSTNQNRLINIKQSMVKQNINFENLYLVLVKNMPICL